MRGFLRLKMINKNSTLFKRKKRKPKIKKKPPPPPPPPQHAVDRLTALPLDLRQLILSLLPLKDAVSTAALSSAWCRPDLPFVDCLLLDLDNDHDSSIDYALRLLSSPAPTALLRRLEIPNLASINPHSSRCLLGGAADRGLQELALHNPSLSRPYPWVPRLVLRCKSLRILSVSYCSLRYSSLRCRLTSLTSLKLHCVRIYDRLFNHIVSSCTALRRLETVYCELLHAVRIHAKNLKHLLIRPSKALKKISVVAPSLLTLTLYTQPMLEELSIRAPRVRKAFLHLALPSVDWGVKVEEFVAGATELERLTLRGNSIHFLIREESFPVPFRMLRFLSISLDLRIQKHIFVFLKLLESCPNLRELNLSLLSGEEMPGDDQCMEEHADSLGRLPCLPDHLEQVELSGFRAWNIECMFLGILLREAKVLKKMVLKIPEGCSGKKVVAARELLASQEGSIRERTPFRKFRRIQLDLPRSKLRC